MYLDESSNSHVFQNAQYRIKAKPDVLEQDKGHGFIVREYKSRHSGTYPTDKIQLTATVLAVRGEGLAVANGTIETANGEVHHIKFNAPSDALYKQIAPIVMQARLAISGVQPTATPTTNKCRVCSYQQQCPYARL